MATNYPGSLDTGTEQPSPLSTTEMDDAGFEHDVVHTNHSEAIIALETKVGVGSSSAVADSVLAGTGSGTSGWSTAPSLAGLTVDTDTLHVDATNDRVGIGTTSPATTLDIGTGVAGTAPSLRFTDIDTGVSVGENVGRIEFYSEDTDAAGGNGVGSVIAARGASSTGGHRLDFDTGEQGGTVSTRMTIDNTGNVGIGTTTPASLLEVSSATGTTPTSPTEVRISTSTDGGSWSTTAPWGQLSFYSADSSNGGAKVQAAVAATPIESFGGLARLGLWTHDGTSLQERLSVTNSGNVGIGTTGPGAPLHLFGAGNDVDQIKISSTNGATSEYGFLGANASSNYLRYGYWTGSGFGSHKFEGSVGIGTGSPQTALEVRNDIITVRSTASGTNTVGTDKGIALVAAGMNTSSQFTPGLLFGSIDPQFTTTNPKYNAGIFGRADETYGNDSDTGMSIQMRFAGNNAGTGHGVTGAYGYAFGPTVLHCMVDNVADLGLSVRRWDDVYATNGTIQTSDERDKANVTDLTLGLAFVDSLRPVSYTWNDRSGYVGTREHMGFVAQEIAAVLGDDAADLAVWTHTESTEETDEEGNTVTTVDRQGLRYNELMAPMVKAIQELSSRVTALEAA